MKAKITASKLRFLMLCLTVLFSVMGLSFSASAEEGTCTHPNLTESGWTIVKETTCQGAGEKTQWCYDCASLVKRNLPFDPYTAPHVKGEWVIESVHTCQQDGVQVQYCYYGCEYNENNTHDQSKWNTPVILATKTIPAHDYSVIYKEPASCINTGYQFVACLTCYDMKTEELPIDTSETGHNFTEWKVVKEATCAEEGLEERTCRNCLLKPSRPIEKNENHINVVWDEENAVPATCEKPGYVPGRCDGCPAELKKEIPQHTNSSYISISKTPSTCHENGIERRLCKCGLEYDWVLPLDDNNHVYGEWIIEKEPGCTDGVRAKYCAYHNEAKVTEAVPSNGVHNYGEWTTVTEPDCSKTGLETRTCLDCKKVESRELPTKHDFAKWTVIAEMSCDERELVNGTRLAECDNCSYEKYFTIPAVHDFSEWRVVVKADCKDTGRVGTMERYCSGCGKVETKEYYAEHTYTDWYVTGRPVCASEKGSGMSGIYTRWCTACKKYEHKAIGTDHEFVELEIKEYPRCYENGSTATGTKIEKCKFCDKTRSVTIPAEHTFGEWVITKENSCNAQGSKNRTCICCGFVEAVSIPAGHNYGKWVYDDESVSCGHNFGKDVELHRYCTNEGCNVRDSKVLMVKEFNHPNTVTVVNEATCTTSGYTVEICLDCGNEAISNIVVAKGHTLDEHWTDKLPATCHTNGTHYKACADCDYLEFEYIDKTAHTLIELTPGLAPTCTTAGYSSESFCAVCKEVFPSEKLEPLGHDIPEGTEICTRCLAYKDTDCTCACHSKTGMEGIFFKFINKLYQLFGINQKCKCGVLHYDEPGLFAKLFGKA